MEHLRAELQCSDLEILIFRYILNSDDYLAFTTSDIEFFSDEIDDWDACLETSRRKDNFFLEYVVKKIVQLQSTWDYDKCLRLCCGRGMLEMVKFLEKKCKFSSSAWELAFSACYEDRREKWKPSDLEGSLVRKWRFITFAWKLASSSCHEDRLKRQWEINVLDGSRRKKWRLNAFISELEFSACYEIFLMKETSTLQVFKHICSGEKVYSLYKVIYGIIRCGRLDMYSLLSPPADINVHLNIAIKYNNPSIFTWIEYKFPERIRWRECLGIAFSENSFDAF